MSAKPPSPTVKDVIEQLAIGTGTTRSSPMASPIATPMATQSAICSGSRPDLIR